MRKFDLVIAGGGLTAARATKSDRGARDAGRETLAQDDFVGRGSSR